MVYFYSMADYKIHLKNIRLMMSLGINPEEKTRPQAVLIDVVLHCDRPRQFVIDQVVDYDSLLRDITNCCGARHYDLVEELADVIANHCLSLHGVQSVKINITKPEALQGKAMPMITWKKSI